MCARGDPLSLGVAKAKPGKPAAAYPELAFATVAAWSTWLTKHHATSTGIAMRIARKGGGGASTQPRPPSAALSAGPGSRPTINYAEALEVAPQILSGTVRGRLVVDVNA